MNPIISLIYRRLALSIFIAILAASVVFFGTEILPGDALTATIPEDELAFMSDADLARMRTELGLDKPVYERFRTVIWNLITFDFGLSTITQEPVWDFVSHPMKNSLIMAGTAVILTPIFSIMLGVFASLKPGGRLDNAISGFTLFSYSMPDFVVGNIFIIIFGIWLAIAPAVLMVSTSAPALDMVAVSFLPVLALVVSGIAYQFRLLRAGMVEALDSDYVERARLSGVPEWRLVIVHALPSALIPMLNGLAQWVAGIISNVVVIEAVFKYPGIGLELVRSLASREIPVVQAIAFIAAFAVIFTNLLADLSILALDPRVRRASNG
jgi:peptide/nickel transport system permease protein